MGLRIEEAQPDMDAFELYDDMREEDMMECIGLMHHPKDAVNISFETSSKWRASHLWRSSVTMALRCALKASRS